MKLRGGDLDRHRGQVLVGDRPLHEAEVAGAKRPHRSGVPRLSTQPPKRGQAVGALIERAELAARPECAPYALNDDLEPALGHQPSEQQPHELPAPVWRAHEDGGRRAIRALASHPAVGEEHGSVVHRGTQITAADDVEGLGPREPHAPGEDLACKSHGASRR